MTTVFASEYNKGRNALKTILWIYVTAVPNSSIVGKLYITSYLISISINCATKKMSSGSRDLHGKYVSSKIANHFFPPVFKNYLPQNVISCCTCTSVV